MANLKRAILVGLSITGAIIGVGFASGREVVTFFVKYGFWSVILFLVVGLLFSVFSYLIMNVAYLKKCKTTQNGVNFTQSFTLCGKQKRNIDYFSVILFICQVAITSAMFAGIGCVFTAFFDKLLIDIFVRIIIFVFVFILLKYSSRGVYVINTILSVLLIVSIFAVFALSLFRGNYDVLTIVEFKLSFLYMPLLYVGMNLLTAYPIIYEVGEESKTKKERLLISFFIGLFIFFVLLVIGLTILLFGNSFIAKDMPMVNIVNNYNIVFGTIYLIVVCFAIVTTLVSTGYGASKCLNKKLGKTCSIIVVLLISLLLSFVGFSKIIDKIYPILGFVCLLAIIIKLFKVKQ